MEKKYIVELYDENVKSIGGYDWLQLLISVADKAVMVETAIQLLPCTEPDVEKIRKEAYDKGYEDATVKISSNEQAIAEKAYQSGLNDTWAAARKLWDYDPDTLKEIFGWVAGKRDVFIIYTAAEVIEKIRQYEQKQEEIHLGDEVTFLPNNAKGIVTECHVPDVYSDNDKYAVWCGGTMEYVLKQHLTKTGRTFPEIAEILQKMKEES